MKRKHGLFGVTLLLGILLPGTSISAQQLTLEWAGSQAEFDSYVPQKVPLETVRPAEIRSVPPGVKRPQYGRVLVGPRETRRAYTILIDESEEQDQRLWFDTNGNGDLDDDPPPRWERVTKQGSRTAFSGSVTLRVKYGNEVRSLELALYRQRAASGSDATPPLYCYRRWGYRGEAVLEGKTYKAMLDDQLSTGDFRGSDTGKDSGVFLLLDVNGDGRFDSRGERFDVKKPFNIGGTTYELALATASGTGMTLVRSSQSVPETKPNAVFKVGGHALPFVATMTTGQTIRFPGDFRGKVVLLDFWATWCGPCRQELPNLKKVYEDFHSRGFEVIAISLDNADALDRLEKYTQENGIAWPQISEGKGWDDVIARAYNVTGIPAGFLVDGSTGTIAAMGSHVVGTSLRTAVEKALAAPRSTPAVYSSVASPTPSISMSWSRGQPTAPARTPARTIVWSNPRPTAVNTSQPSADPLLARISTAAKAGRLMTSAQLLERRKAPVPGRVELVTPSTHVLPGRNVARIAREGYLRVGWYYKCGKCNQWHLKLGGGYAVASNTIVTAWHVMTPPSTGGTDYAVAIDSSENLVSITGVLAASERMDVIVMRVTGGDFKPLALNPAAQVGDPAFCFSDPLKQRNYFSAGIVNRFHGVNDDGGKGAALDDLLGARMNVSTDWGPGSSGAAVLDSSANVIGHVATIRSLFDHGEKLPPSTDAAHGEERGAPLMTLHDAIPARSVLSLLKP
jgi:thiol-disulfide isomerase/thioredoxin